MSNASDSPRTDQPVVPADLIRASYHSGMGDRPLQQSQPTQQARSPPEECGASLKSPRTARFAEATTAGGVGDTGFGYVAASDPAQHAADSRPPMTPALASPLRSGLRVPNTAKSLNPLSPTFREEYMLEKQEKETAKENARDLRVKVRIRIAKMFLRGVNFSCSLIVMALLATTLTIFEATKSLPPRNSLPAWAQGTNPWAQYLLLGLASFSLFACLIVFWGYWKGGHRRAEKVTVYYTTFSICFFAFNFIMWIVAASIYQHTKATSNNKDMWGWSCAQNTREQLYSNTVNYALLCRLQDWGLVCAVIEIVIELIVLLIYGVVAYRVWSKRRLMKTMDGRDQARSDLYLAQLRMQSAPNTPGFPGYASYPGKSPYVVSVDPLSSAEKGQAEPTTTQYASPRSPTRPVSSFQLQAPPSRHHQSTPQAQQGGFTMVSPPRAITPPTQNEPQHVAAAPGETNYGAVPIPGAYTSPMMPAFPPAVHQ
ncbi:Uncharacterized protein PECH_001022 [Penicillium ucsense]|uniref:MARVEL domain-containing protein n=1 Tax=Penicillium ucsense TaxID=2839758 RepID=A0A8J8W630_9EURO|nr:Uncharacterized protein PECM_002419 [Penicillium ucsense]KAF7738263.1 Uncharacterized protein PECH_001022 [Penicillium ucsense]